ncbi:response regulator [Gammaproteobacteria bacterium]|nr:response regulator [Gammaproteobacteria bacterium]
MKPYIICVDDQSEVLNALYNDLDKFKTLFEIECCGSVDEALELANSLDDNGQHLALVISDHRMPDKTGLTLLVSLQKDSRFKGVKKIMLTGQANHQDTILAINDAKIDAYIPKPWTEAVITAEVSKALTNFLFDQGLYEDKYLKLCNQATVLERLHG